MAKEEEHQQMPLTIPTWSAPRVVSLSESVRYKPSGSTLPLASERRLNDLVLTAQIFQRSFVKSYHNITFRFALSTFCINCSWWTRVFFMWILVYWINDCWLHLKLFWLGGGCGDHYYLPGSHAGCDEKAAVKLRGILLKTNAKSCCYLWR